MKTPIRLSPVHDPLRWLNTPWREFNGMPTIVQFAADLPVGLVDLSCLRRFGVKGSAAADWLTSQGIIVPDRPNTWNPIATGGMVARLGLTEFLVEDYFLDQTNANPTPVHQIADSVFTASLPPKVYPVLRQDLAIALYGKRVNDLLRQTCSVNFPALVLRDRPVLLTSLVGVAVTIVPSERRGESFYRIWCDGTFGRYVWQTLLEIGLELGGGVVGVEQISPVL